MSDNSNVMPERQEKKKKNRFWLVVLLLSVLTFAVSVGLILFFFNPLKKYENAAAEKYAANDLEQELTEKEENLPDRPKFLVKAMKDNKDVIGWIQVPGTGKSKTYAAINYPVLQSSPGEEENFYLTHDFEKRLSHDAAIYVQRLNQADFTDPNTVIYGHDLADRTMFTALRQYYDKNFFDKYDTVYVAIPGHILTYKIYSAFVFDDRHVLNSFDFSDKKSYKEFLDITLHPSSEAYRSRLYQVRDGVKVTTDDRILTLSTCTPNSNDSERFLVIGVLTHDKRTK